MVARIKLSGTESSSLDTPKHLFCFMLMPLRLVWGASGGTCIFERVGETRHKHPYQCSGDEGSPAKPQLLPVETYGSLICPNV